MKTLTGAVVGLLGVFFLLSAASANPALLPKHPGYPAGQATSPVTGQPLANDPGQTNLVGKEALLQAAEVGGIHANQNLADPNNQRLVEKQGAGRLPTVQGPQIKIEPPVKEATRMLK